MLLSQDISLVLSRVEAKWISFVEGLNESLGVSEYENS